MGWPPVFPDLNLWVFLDTLLYTQKIDNVKKYVILYILVYQTFMSLFTNQLNHIYLLFMSSYRLILYYDLFRIYLASDCKKNRKVEERKQIN